VATRREKDVDLVVELEAWKEGRNYDRLGLDDHLGDLALVARVRTELRAVPVGKRVDEPESRVVTREPVFGPRIAEPDHDLQRCAGHDDRSAWKKRKSGRPVQGDPLSPAA
jgi:hypothetical protein